MWLMFCRAEIVERRLLQQQGWMRCRAELTTEAIHTFTHKINAKMACRQPLIDSPQITVKCFKLIALPRC